MVAVNSGLVAYPLSFKKIGYTSGLSIWEPQPPEGFVAMGHLALGQNEEPDTKDVVCVHASRLTASSLGECLELRDGDRSPGDLNVWNVDNAGATFLACPASSGSPSGTPAKTDSSGKMKGRKEKRQACMHVLTYPH